MTKWDSYVLHQSQCEAGQTARFSRCIIAAFSNIPDGINFHHKIWKFNSPSWWHQSTQRKSSPNKVHFQNQGLMPSSSGETNTFTICGSKFCPGVFYGRWLWGSWPATQVEWRCWQTFDWKNFRRCSIDLIPMWIAWNALWRWWTRCLISRLSSQLSNDQQAIMLSDSMYLLIMRWSASWLENVSIWGRWLSLSDSPCRPLN